MPSTMTSKANSTANIVMGEGRPSGSLKGSAKRDGGPPGPQYLSKKQIKTSRIQFLALCWTLFLAGWNDGSTGPLLPRIQNVYHVCLDGVQEFLSRLKMQSRLDSQLFPSFSSSRAWLVLAQSTHLARELIASVRVS